MKPRFPRLVRAQEPQRDFGSPRRANDWPGLCFASRGRQPSAECGKMRRATMAPPGVQPRSRRYMIQAEAFRQEGIGEW